MNKKVVWLPYDFDTALGINNEGALVFSYNLEDIDHLEGGANVYNGQESVVWCNIRDAFGDDIKTMYQTLRSQDDLSYDIVETMFETHQDKWSEAIFNEDSYFKYLAPLVSPDAGKEPTGAYLNMLQGSKKEQRKWWLYNRFRYLDSKYNAGDAQSDVIQLRGYAKANVTITPYADVYASVKYGSYLVQSRAERDVPVTLICPLDQVNDTEIYIYSASQLADIGDLSGFKVGFADFSMGTKLQTLKVGDSSANYSNNNLKELYLGNNTLLQTLDVRNCVALGTDTKKTVDISGCTNIEYIYFDGTSIQGLTLPNGGIIKTLHLPATLTNLTLMNQNVITDLTVADYSNISTLRLENVPTIDSIAILMDIPDNTRVRLIGISYEAEDADEIDDILDKLDNMRGLDENGNTVDKAQVSGMIHTDALTGAQIAYYNSKYPYLTFTADHITCKLRYYNYDGSTLLNEETLDAGEDGTWTTQPTKPSTPAYVYTFVGWNLQPDQTTADPNAMKNITMDRNIYAAYTSSVRTYTVRFYNGENLLQTTYDVPYGGTATYTGSIPVHPSGDTEQYVFNGWNPSNENIQGDTNCLAKFKNLSSYTRRTINKTINDASDEDITYIRPYAFAFCSSLTTANFPSVTSIGKSAFTSCSYLSTISFPAAVHIDDEAFSRTTRLSVANFPAAIQIGSRAFAYCSSLMNLSFPALESVGYGAFISCGKLTTLDFPNVTTIASSAFAACYSITTVSFPAATYIGQNALVSCSSMTSMYFPSLEEVDWEAFARCKGLTTVNLPSAKKIGTRAFISCSSLTTITLPVVSSIGASGFYDCRQLMSVYLTSSSIVSLSSGWTVFSNTPMLNSTYTGAFGSIYVPASLVSGYKALNYWSSYIDRITSYIE